jgi:hypothetical protein
MGPEGSLTFSQELAISPYHDLDESNPQTPIHFPKIPFNIILSSTPRSQDRSLPFKAFQL